MSVHGLYASFCRKNLLQFHCCLRHKGVFLLIRTRCHKRRQEDLFAFESIIHNSLIQLLLSFFSNPSHLIASKGITLISQKRQ